MSKEQPKVVDLIKMSDDTSYSFEVTPNLREDLVTGNLEVEPLFYSITWHATQHEFLNLDIAPIRLARTLKMKNKNVMLHLSCNMLRKSFLNSLLVMLQNEGICNLFVILGEKYNSDTSDFKSTQELICYIRETTGDYFCIGVAGNADQEHKFRHLKDKIVSGANFIITQACFDVEGYANFLKKCEAEGITVPILPGIFPFDTEEQLKGFVNLCKVHVTEKIMNDVKTLSGSEILSKLKNDLSTILNFKHFHFFTLDNIERALKLIKSERNVGNI